MASIQLKKVVKRYGKGKHELQVIHGVDAEVADREFIVIVGPSGCGKSTLLRMVAGLEEISGGEIAIGNRVVNNLEPAQRDIAMVFQNYALYPHMTVRDNMSFALMLAKKSKAGCARLPACWRWSTCWTATPSSSPAGRRSAWRWAAPS